MSILNKDSFFPLTSSPFRQTWEDTYVMTKWVLEMLKAPRGGDSALQCQRPGKWGAERGGDWYYKPVARSWVGCCTRQVTLFLLYRWAGHWGSGKSLIWGPKSSPGEEWGSAAWLYAHIFSTACRLVGGLCDHFTRNMYLSSLSFSLCLSTFSESLSLGLTISGSLVCVGISGTFSEILTQDLCLPGSQPAVLNLGSVWRCLLVTQREWIQDTGRNTGRDGDNEQYKTVWQVKWLTCDGIITERKEDWHPDC